MWQTPETLGPRGEVQRVRARLATSVGDGKVVYERPLWLGWLRLGHRESLAHYGSQAFVCRQDYGVEGRKSA